MRVRVLGSCLLGASIAVPTTASAGFKCGFNRIAAEGDTTAEVRVKCGPPRSEETFRTDDGDVTFQRWIYKDPGGHHWIKILEFRDGRLDSITETKE